MKHYGDITKLNGAEKDMSVFEQMSVLDFLPTENTEITLSSKVEHDEIVQSIEKHFDFKSDGGA